MNDLLVLNLREESNRMPFSEQWYKITHFLGCPNVSEIRLPHHNSAQDSDDRHVSQMDFFPRNYSINWQNYTIPDRMKRIVDVVGNMEGTFDETRWRELKQAYKFLLK